MLLAEMDTETAQGMHSKVPHRLMGAHKHCLIQKIQRYVTSMPPRKPAFNAMTTKRRALHLDSGSLTHRRLPARGKSSSWNSESSKPAWAQEMLKILNSSNSSKSMWRTVCTKHLSKELMQTQDDWTHGKRSEVLIRSLWSISVIEWKEWDWACPIHGWASTDPHWSIPIPRYETQGQY